MSAPISRGSNYPYGTFGTEASSSVSTINSDSNELSTERTPLLKAVDTLDLSRTPKSPTETLHPIQTPEAQATYLKEKIQSKCDSRFKFLSNWDENQWEKIVAKRKEINTNEKEWLQPHYLKIIAAEPTHFPNGGSVYNSKDLEKADGLMKDSKHAEIKEQFDADHSTIKWKSERFFNKLATESPIMHKHYEAEQTHLLKLLKDHGDSPESLTKVFGSPESLTVKPKTSSTSGLARLLCCVRR
jgi:hypothetical protein